MSNFLKKSILKSKALYWGVVGLVVGADQLSKHYAQQYLDFFHPIVVNDFWNWVLVYNSGAAFGVLSHYAGWQRYFLSALAIIVSVFLGVLLQKEKNLKNALAFAFIIGGALGNVIDRLSYGAVVDFIQWHFKDYYWPAFNLADSFITLGVVLMLLSFPTKK